MTDELAARRDASVTPEDFTAEHWKKLKRGIEIAAEAFDLKAADLAIEERRSGELRAQLGSLEEQVSQMRFEEGRWDELLELIGDVERGVRTTTELFMHVRSLV